MALEFVISLFLYSYPNPHPNPRAMPWAKVLNPFTVMDPSSTTPMPQGVTLGKCILTSWGFAPF